MAAKTDPWYVHLVLYVIIAGLTFLLIKVAIIDPKEIVAREKFFRTEARLRMSNLKEAQILYERKYDRFTGSLDTLINFIKNDPYVDSVVEGYDSITERSTNPFHTLSHGKFEPESLYYTPKSGKKFIMEIDTNRAIDSVVTTSGRLKRVDTNLSIGENYYIEDPDGYGTVGDLYNVALKNTASWE